MILCSQALQPGGWFVFVDPPHSFVGVLPKAHRHALVAQNLRIVFHDPLSGILQPFTAIIWSLVFLHNPPAILWILQCCSEISLQHASFYSSTSNIQPKLSLFALPECSTICSLERPICLERSPFIDVRRCCPLWCCWCPVPVHWIYYSYTYILPSRDSWGFEFLQAFLYLSLTFPFPCCRFGRWAAVLTLPLASVVFRESEGARRMLSASCRGLSSWSLLWRINFGLDNARTEKPRESCVLPSIFQISGIVHFLPRSSNLPISSYQLWSNLSLSLSSFSTSWIVLSRCLSGEVFRQNPPNQKQSINRCRKSQQTNAASTSMAFVSQLFQYLPTLLSWGAGLPNPNSGAWENIDIEIEAKDAANILSNLNSKKDSNHSSLSLSVSTCLPEELLMQCPSVPLKSREVTAPTTRGSQWQNHGELDGTAPWRHERSKDWGTVGNWTPQNSADTNHRSVKHIQTLHHSYITTLYYTILHYTTLLKHFYGSHFIDNLWLADPIGTW